MMPTTAQVVPLAMASVGSHLLKAATVASGAALLPSHTRCCPIHSHSQAESGPAAAAVMMASGLVAAVAQNASPLLAF
jgi:hypothetical protein